MFLQPRRSQSARAVQPPPRQALPHPDLVRVGGRGDGGPTRYRIDSDTRADAADRRRMERDLATATREGQFVLQYQPRLALDSLRRVGAEALIRWPHRKRGMVSPGQFLPLAERSGQLAGIGGWALQSASTDAAAWPEQLTVSVTISATQLDAPVLLGQLAVALEVSGIAPERLEIALSESLLADVGMDTFLALCAVRDLGVGVALDDFGAGVASLCLLKRLPLTTLKLDRSMLRDVPADREDAALVRATIDAAHALGLIVVAGGLETDAQRCFLAGAGCDHAQGALFGYPIAADQLATAPAA